MPWLFSFFIISTPVNFLTSRQSVYVYYVYVKCHAYQQLRGYFSNMTKQEKQPHHPMLKYPYQSAKEMKDGIRVNNSIGLGRDR